MVKKTIKGGGWVRKGFSICSYFLIFNLFKIALKLCGELTLAECQVSTKLLSHSLTARQGERVR